VHGKASFILLGMMLVLGKSARADDLETRRQGFQTLLAEQWEYMLSHGPEFASILRTRFALLRSPLSRQPLGDRSLNAGAKNCPME